MSHDGVFDVTVAATYDADTADRFASTTLEAEVGFLAGLARHRPALELAVGTGRVALPLAEHGVEVVGIEMSEAMVDQLRSKPGGDAIDVIMGDMATTRVDREFGLVYLVFNTIMNLVTQDEQVACFENAAAHLVPGGRFVVEVVVPQIQRLAHGERFVPFDVSRDHVGIDEYDIATQRSVSHHLRPGRSTHSVPFRYVWPAELDLMARIAGLEFGERWADFERTPFTSTSRSHVSVWTKPDA